MDALALGLPPTGLIVQYAWGNFFRGMGNVSNIYCRGAS